MLGRTATLLSAACLSMALMAGCGGGGSSDPKPTDTEDAPTFDPDELDLGRIDPTGIDVTKALSPELARRTAAYQLAEYLVLPEEIDSSLFKYGVETGPMIDQRTLDYGLGDVGPSMAEAEIGVLSRRQDDSSDAWITTALVQFPDEAAAQRAVDAAAVALTAPDESGQPTKVLTPMELDDRLIAAETTTPDIANSVVMLRAFGEFVSYVWAYDIRGDMDDVRDHALEAVSTQESELDGVDPIDFSESPSAREVDSTRLFSLTLANDNRGAMGATAYVASSHAALLQQIDSRGIDDAFDDAGVRRVAVNGSDSYAVTVYATSDEEGAASLVEQFAAQAKDVGLTEVDPPVGLDDAICLEKSDDLADAVFWPTFLCFHAQGEYAYEAQSVTLSEAHQRLSAQAVLIYEQTGEQKRSSSR